MSNASASWPCPVCAQVVPAGPLDCPHCRTPATWIDRLLALDFAIRRFHLCSLEGGLEKGQYRQIVEDSRLRREEMARAAQAGMPAPEAADLPARAQCWNCTMACPAQAKRCVSCGVALDSAEVRMGRYLTHLGHEIRRHAAAGRIGAGQAEQLLADTEKSLQELRARLRG